MWEEVDETVEDEMLRSGRAAEHEDLVVVLECDRPHVAGVRFCLEGVVEVLIGRGVQRAATRSGAPGERCLTITVPDPHMSSSHAKLLRTATGWVISDRNSRNGTVVDGRPSAQAAVKHGTLLELGHTYFLFRVTEQIATVLPDAEPQPASLDATGLELCHVRQAALERLSAVARDGLPILLTGEPSVGKRRLARALHEDARRDGRFVVFDCCLAARDAGKSGSMTGFTAELARAIESSADGTLVLNDVAALGSEAQVGLLRLLSSASQRIALITILPTDPSGNAKFPTLQPSLLAYLRAFEMFVPPMRDRKEELGALISSILREWSEGDTQRFRLDPSLADSLLRHDWPCNVRELENCVRSAIVLSPDGVLRPGVSAAALLARSAESSESGEMPVARPPEAVPAPVDVEPEFAQNVRRALRCNLSIAGLQRNGLIHSYMVLARTNGSSTPAITVPALREMILEAIQAMRASPKGERQSRVLHLTFVAPTATQYEAAERLGMAFGTYRRYVTSAIAELTANLWFAEISARLALEQPKRRVSAL